MMGSGRIVHFAMLIAVFAILSSARPAQAIVLSEAQSGFRIDASAPGTAVCVVHPIAQRDPVACRGEDLPSGDPVSSGTNLEVGTVRFLGPERRFAMTVLRSAVPGQTEMSAARADEFIVGFRGGLARTPGVQLAAVTPPGRHEQLTIHGRQVLRHVVELIRAPGQTDPDRYLTYHVIGADAVVTISFITWAADLPRVEPLAAAMMQTVDMNAPRPAVEGSAAYVAGQLLCLLTFFLLVAGVIRALRRRSTTLAPQPPMPPYGQPHGGPWQPQGGPYGQAPGNAYGPSQAGPWQPQGPPGQPQAGPYVPAPNNAYGQPSHGQYPAAPYGPPQGGLSQPPGAAPPQGAAYAPTEFVPLQPPPGGPGGWRPPGGGSQQ